jgi:hypothetical protein
MFGYVGPGPGQELIPYFLALLGFLLTAALAVVQWPFLALWRLIRGQPAESPQGEASTAPAPAPPPTVPPTPEADRP